MTPDDPLRAIFSAADETIRELDALHSGSRARQADFLGQLRQVVARLDAPSLPDDEPEPVERPYRVDERRRPRQERDLTEEEAEALLPQRRTSRGGPMGPALRSRLVRIALEKSSW